MLLLISDINYLGEKIVAIVKQGQGEISFQNRVKVLGELIALGAEPPYFSGERGSYALLGYKRSAGQSISWTKQVLNTEGKGISEISADLPLLGKSETRNLIINTILKSTKNIS